MLRATEPKIPTNRKSPCRVAGACLRHRHAPDSLKRSLLLPHHRLFLSSTLLWLHHVKAHLFHEHFEGVFWGSHRPRYQLCPLKISPKCWSDLLVFLHDNLVRLMPHNLSLIAYFETESTFFFCSLFFSVYMCVIASVNWRENPTITTLKVIVSLSS